MERVLSVVPELRRWRARIRPALGDGSSFLIGAHGAQTFLRLGSNLILTRLLAPEAYGVVGIIMSVTYILQMASDMGLRSYIVRHQDAGPELLQTVWTIRLMRNILLALIMFLGAGLFAQAYNAPDVATALRVASAVFILDALASFGFTLTERNRRVIRLTTVEFIRFLITTATAITAAFFLRNYWAIVISMFAASAFTVFASYFILPGPKVGLRLEKGHFKDLWSYWRYIIPASIITIILTQSDVFLVANFFPIAELGKFTIAATLATTVFGLTQAYTMRVFFPRFAHAHRTAPDTELEVYYGVRRQVTLLFAFGLGGLIGGSELIVKILYNDLYLGAGIYLSILCLRPLARLSTYPAEQAIISKGFIRISLTANVLRLIWVAIAAPTAYFLYGPIAVIIAMSLADVALAPFFLFQQKKFNLLRVGEELLIPLAAGVGAAIGYAAYRGAIAAISAGLIPDF
jgi:O-antigen/teichoic acid export membrane protein